MSRRLGALAEDEDEEEESEACEDPHQQSPSMCAEDGMSESIVQEASGVEFSRERQPTTVNHRIFAGKVESCSKSLDNGTADDC